MMDVAVAAVVNYTCCCAQSASPQRAPARIDAPSDACGGSAKARDDRRIGSISSCGVVTPE